MLTLWNVDDFTSPEVYAALVAVVGAVVGAVLLYLSTIWVARKNLFVATITSERAKWRDDLRVATVNLFPAVRAALITPNAMTLGNYDRCRIAIRLRLNPERTDASKLDSEILNALKSLSVAIHEQAEVKAWAQLETIERCVQLLIKNEWEKSKDEAQKGKLKR